jgi:hypothetical protein
MTATLTPAHPSAIPLKLAASSNSYWDSLKPDEKLASINEHRSRKLGKKTAWFPEGVVLKRWTEEIYPTISTIINDAGNYERIFGKYNKEVTRPCWLYMVGEGGQWTAARPTIVALCSKTRIAQRICDLLRNIECMRTLNLGFDYMAHKERAILIAGEDYTTGLPNSHHPDIEWNLCGSQVLASTYPPSPSAKWKEATAGGTLKIDGEYYCLTVAHAFHLKMSVFGDGGSDSSMDSSESSDCIDDFYPASDLQSSASVLTCPPDMLDDLDLGLYLRRDSAQSATRFQDRNHTDCAPTAITDIELIGRGRLLTPEAPTLRRLLLCKETDWALFRIKDPRFFKGNLVQTPSGAILSPQKVSSSPPDGKVIVAAGTSGVFESNCPGLVGGLLLPGCTQMIDVWTIDSLCCKISDSAPMYTR